jgi:hypothetical protein
MVFRAGNEAFLIGKGTAEFLESSSLHHLFAAKHLRSKLYNDQLNAQVLFILFIYLLLPYMFLGYGVSARALTEYPGDVNHGGNCTPASEDGLKESPKHVRQK